MSRELTGRIKMNVVLAFLSVFLDFCQPSTPVIASIELLEKLKSEMLLIVQSDDWQEELKQIDSELHELDDMKNKYKASAARHENDGLRWQSMQNLKQESRRAYQQADLDNEMVKQVQTRMDYLEARKAEILKKHPEANAVKKSS